MENFLAFPNPQDAHVEPGVALVGPSEFVDSALTLGRPFQESMPTIGRRDVLAALVDFASARGPQRVAVVPGRAGMGKSSLLAALADALAAQRVGTMLRFAIDITVTGTPSAPRLPPGPCLIVIDDAARKSAPSALLPVALEHRDVRFVFTTRPAGAPRLRASFAQAGLSADTIRWLPELAPLGPEDALTAASHALGDVEAAHADKLSIFSNGQGWHLVSFVVSLSTWL